MLTITDYLIIACYFVLILIVGFWTGRKQEKEEFLISGRNLKSLQATTTIFSSRIGAAILLTYTALVYLYGLGALWYFIGSVFGLFVFYFFGIKVKKIADKQKFYTMPDFMNIVSCIVKSCVLKKLSPIHKQSKFRFCDVNI